MKISVFDVCTSHGETGELLIKVSFVLFSKQSCIRKVKVRYTTSSVGSTTITPKMIAPRKFVPGQLGFC